MKLRSIIPVACAIAAIAGVSNAEAQSNKHRHHGGQNQQMQNGALSVGAGTASADRRGADAGAVIGSATTAGSTRCGMAPSTATTFGTGATYTDRRTASGAASTGGTASGSGAAASSSDADVYSTTDRQGSDAGAYGGSSANAQASTQRPRGC